MDAAPPKTDTMLSERDAGDTMDQWIESMDVGSLPMDAGEAVDAWMDDGGLPNYMCPGMELGCLRARP